MTNHFHQICSFKTSIHLDSRRDAVFKCKVDDIECNVAEVSVERQDRVST